MPDEGLGLVVEVEFAPEVLDDFLEGSLELEPIRVLVSMRWRETRRLRRSW